MNIRQTAVAIFAAAAIMTGTAVATSTPAEAGYKVKVKVRPHYKVRHVYRVKPVRYHYVRSCYWKRTKVFYSHGPVWVRKRVCY